MGDTARVGRTASTGSHCVDPAATRSVETANDLSNSDDVQHAARDAERGNLGATRVGAKGDGGLDRAAVLSCLERSNP